MIISFVNQKGGVGKTTIAINIAASLKRRNNKVILFDADPQGSATQWHAVENNNAFNILHHPQPIHKSDVEELSQNYDYLVIDGPPGINTITKSILAVTELSIIPLTPSPLDLWASKGTLEIIKEIIPQNPDIDVKLLINRKIFGTRVGHEVREALEVFNIDVLDTELFQRVVYINAMISGISVMQYAPKSKAADEIEHLCDEITLKNTAEKSLKQAQNPYIASFDIQDVVKKVLL
jgi:chromosome partitioning protein